MSAAPVSIGVAGALGPTVIARVAAAAEAAGLAALWVNDTPGGDSLAALAAAAAATSDIRLGTGVIPLDRRGVAEIAAAASDLPVHRTVLGVGTGQAVGPVLARTRDAVRALRERTAASVLVGALGPRMRELAVHEADGMLLNWLTPAHAAAQTQAAHGEDAGTRVVLYVRTALDEAAVGRLRAEAARYAGFAKYAANFARLGITAADTVLTPGSAADVLPDYRKAVDEVVLRAICPADDEVSLRRFIDQTHLLLR